MSLRQKEGEKEREEEIGNHASRYGKRCDAISQWVATISSIQYTLGRDGQKVSNTFHSTALKTSFTYLKWYFVFSHNSRRKYPESNNTETRNVKKLKMKTKNVVCMHVFTEQLRLYNDVEDVSCV